MKSFTVKPISRLTGEVVLPGDKSIAHRCIMAGAISTAKTSIKNFPFNEDCLATIRVFQALGIGIKQQKKSGVSCGTIVVTGQGLRGLKKPSRPIIIKESGTTFRLIAGILAGQSFPVILKAGKNLSRRPMLRITRPLRMMGAVIRAAKKKKKGISEEYPPLVIHGGNLHSIVYTIPVASAQVKSSLMFAGLYACGATEITEAFPTRNHTENILKAFHAYVSIKKNKLGNVVSVLGGKELVSPGEIYVPGDISSAGFFIVAALIIKNSEITIRKISLNESRAGLIRVLKRMGADIKISMLNSSESANEPVGDIYVRCSHLRGTEVFPEEIPSLIDELPILMVAACFAEGNTTLKGVEELRVKETDRVESMVSNLKKMDAEIESVSCGDSEDIVIKGGSFLRGTKIKSYGDHRTAMSLIVAGLKAEGKTVIDDISCITKSFPDFISVLRRLSDT